MISVSSENQHPGWKKNVRGENVRSITLMHILMIILFTGREGEDEREQVVARIGVRRDNLPKRYAPYMVNQTSIYIFIFHRSCNRFINCFGNVIML